MDVIVLGVYSIDDAYLVEKIASKNNLRVVWNFQDYRIDAEYGMKSLENYFHLHKLGVLIDDKYKDGDFFCSYPLIIEVSDYFMASEWNKETPSNPKLFNFFNSINESTLKKLIVAFADEWTERTTVKIESMDFSSVNKRLTNLYVWCTGFRNLQTNIENRDDFHPLILDLENAST
ncbi:MAG: hypothetical protein IPP69_02895 [Flavobacteriales bacterium]|nr:hypothetical protein [Flavobacteriales bacterium]